MTIIEIPNSEIHAYRADPPGEIKGAVVVIHEIWGLVDHIKNVADRIAEAGYLAVAPDILSNAGVTPVVGQELSELVNNPDETVRSAAQPIMREKLAAANDPQYGAWAVRQLQSTVSYLLDQPGVNGRVAATGFCFGGSYTFALAAHDSRLRCAAPFYGAPPKLDEVSSIGCPIHAFYGGQDTRLMDSLPDVKAAMQSANVQFDCTVYPESKHAFFNDTNAITYDPTSAKDAWSKLLEFFEANLKNSN